VRDVEQATAAWVAWWNNRRLHGTCDRMTPVEYEAAFYARQEVAAASATAATRADLAPIGDAA